LKLIYAINERIADNDFMMDLLRIQSHFFGLSISVGLIFLMG